MTNNFEIEQPLVMRTLKSMIKKGHIPHALIFSGDKSTSKREICTHFIKMLYASYFHEEIRDDGVYHRIENDLCPNIYHIRKDKKTLISAEFIKDAVSEMSRGSVEDGPRVFVIEDSDYLGTFSSNAILKFVEEPLDNCYIIFITENISNLLDTIISRCAVINFQPLSKDVIKKRLEEEGFKDPLLKVFLEYTQNEEQIKSMFENKDYNTIYNLVCEMFDEKFERNGSIILKVNEKFDLIKQESYQDAFLSFVSYYLMDVIKANEDNIEMTFDECKERIKKIRNLFNIQDLSGYLTDILNIKSEVNLKKPINFHLYLDELFLRMEIKARR